MDYMIDTDQSERLKLMEILVQKDIERLKDRSFTPRIQDVLKVIKLKHQLAKSREIEALRRERLQKFHLETINLESQILKTIIKLKHLVKNGILPVKTITDTFNQDKSQESQLSYRRIGQLLSTMGFRKAKTHASAYAIIWDDNLLSQDTVSNDENNENQPSASSARPACPACPYAGCN